MSVGYAVVNIGTLSCNRFWGETQPKRPSHATTTLIRDGQTTILVDPSLPPALLTQQLDDRAGLKPEHIEIVFLTTYRAAHRRGLEALSHATWLMHETEIEAAREFLGQHKARLADQGSSPQAETAEELQAVEAELATLGRFQPAKDKLTVGVHLFPLAGVSPGSAGLLLAHPLRTILVAGDAILTREHAEAGQVFEHCFDVRRAQDALVEGLGIADEIVPGHDNAFMSSV